MSESILQREFKSNDVQRMRNIISKKYNDKTTTQIGYNKSQIQYNEGEVWEENGKQWTIKNGIKQNITRFDTLKQLTTFPLKCPKCNKHMKLFRANKIMWSVHKMCLNCVIDMEAELKLEGKYEEYSSNMIKNGIREYTKEMEDILLDLALNPSEESFITESGDIEVWKGKGIDKTKAIEELQNYIHKLKNITES
jgi:hypothetical protein